MNARDIKSIFANALELPPAGRAAYLDAACAGDTDLRAEVGELLAAAGRSNRFLGDGEGASVPTATPLPDEFDRSADHRETRDWRAPPDAVEPDLAGAVIGERYKLLEPIGAGGMGSVWLAQQTEPVERTVAVKLVKAGMDTRQVLARFDAERQALAVMDHPNIARVLDAGATAAGRPFFVMELVKGVSITEFCDERKLTPRERLALFVPVCQAIQHAHQKGVIHRDVKPSNVLVALYDGRPVPKVIDFGIAKAAGEPLTDKTLNTGFGLVGTPEYMAPEQAELNQLDVDTRADVYALGALLYELLTGAPPFSRAELSGGLLGVLRAVREHTPPRPSARLSTARTRRTVAVNRGTEPRKLAVMMRGELDWIALRALEKDRNRRYETANGLARDVERYLAGEPVRAVPPSAGYRMRTFVRRNRGPVVAVAALFLALTAGAAGTTVGLFRADAARTSAENHRGAAETARTEAERERVAAVAERDAKENARRQAADAKRAADDEREVAEAVTTFLQEDLLGRAGWVSAEGAFRGEMNPTVRTALDRAAARVGDRFRDKPRVEAAIRRTIGEAYESVGEPRSAVAQLTRAVELLEPPAGVDPKSKAVQDYADALDSLAAAYGADRQYRVSIRLFERVLAAREEAYGPDAPETLRAVKRLAGPYAGLADGPTRDRLYRRIAETRARTLGPDHADTLRARYERAWITADRAELKRLIPYLVRARDERVKAAPPARPDVPALVATQELASVYALLGRTEDAIPLFVQVRDGLDALHGRDWIPTLEVSEYLSELYWSLGRTDDSIRELERVWAGWKSARGPACEPAVNVSFALGGAYVKVGRIEDGLRLMEDSVAKSRGVFGPRSPTFANRLERLIAVVERVGAPERAAELWAELRAVRAPLPVAPPPRPVGK